MIVALKNTIYEFWMVFYTKIFFAALCHFNMNVEYFFFKLNKKQMRKMIEHYLTSNFEEKF